MMQCKRLHFSKMNITIKEIAKRANVSIATVSRALNNLDTVKPETKAAILSIAEQLNYIPNVGARNLVKQKTNIIGFVLPEIQGEFYTEIIRGIDEYVYNAGYHMIVASSHSQRSIVESLVNFMKRSFVDGVILMAPSINERVREVLTGSAVPVVVISGKNEVDFIDTVSIDNFQGAYSIVNLLIKNYGYRKIAIIKGPSTNNDALERYEGYVKALSDNKIKLNHKWIVEGNFTQRSGEIACSRILTLRDRPEAIFACNDMMAMGCYKVINSLGFSIPEDIGVVGFDHVLLSDVVLPRLTTVHVPKMELGQEAARLLLEKIDKNPDKTPEHIKISTGIIIGESCTNLYEKKLPSVNQHIKQSINQ